MTKINHKDPTSTLLTDPEPQYGTGAWKRWKRDFKNRERNGLPLRKPGDLKIREKNWKLLQEKEARSVLARRKAKGLF